MESIALYSASFKPALPVYCSASFSITNITDKLKVKHLKVGGYLIDEINELIQDYPNLDSLDISYSGIDYFILQHKHLVKLNATHNQLLHYPFEFHLKMSNLSEIDFSYNSLTSVTNFLSVKCERVHMSHNNISSLDGAVFQDLIKLRFLDLSHNSIVSIDFNMFDGNRALETLRLEANPISKFDCDILSLVKRGVSVYFSWMNIIDLNEECSDHQIRVVSRSRDEGYLHASDGTIELHCNEQSVKQFQKIEIRRENFENPAEIINCLTEELTELSIYGPIMEKMDSNLFHRFVNLTYFGIQNAELFELDLSILKRMNLLDTLEIRNNGLKVMRNMSYLQAIDNIQHVRINENQLENTLEIIQYLKPSVQILSLSHSYIGPINTSSFAKLTNLQNLYLNNVSLPFVENQNPFEPLKKLTELEIDHNTNLQNVNFALLSPTLTSLNIFSAEFCQINNASDMMNLLGPSIVDLRLSGNNVGEINRKTFEKMTSLNILFLKNTNLSFIQSNPFEPIKNLQYLYISDNNLQSINFSMLSSTLQNLFGFHVANCNITNASDVIKYLDMSLHRLDLHGNLLGEVDSSTFKTVTNLQELDLSEMGLSNFDFSILQQQRRLTHLNISNNNLKRANFTSLPRMTALYLHGNDLTELDTLINARTSSLTKLSISLNRFSCEYLRVLLLQLKLKWPSLEYGDDDPWRQKHGINCSLTNQSTIVPISMTNTNIKILITIIVPIVLIILTATIVFVFWRQCCRKATSNEYAAPRIVHTPNGENGIEMAEMPPEITTASTSHEDHIYEEISEREDPYDHLRFPYNPMPILTDTHYHNFLILDGKYKRTILE
ncbi:protein artichoke-like [Sitodiplosis mosellana]|uniref:protein artichoke-like n=1 Tax=Sitodiplosis mosellana TaxID=263140 RepID=UPI002444ED5F|nr:protein artichoke-like [Sitodiplosis mosellana]